MIPILGVVSNIIYFYPYLGKVETTNQSIGNFSPQWINVPNEPWAFKTFLRFFLPGRKTGWKLPAESNLWAGKISRIFGHLWGTVVFFLVFVVEEHAWINLSIQRWKLQHPKMCWWSDPTKPSQANQLFNLGRLKGHKTRRMAFRRSVRHVAASHGRLPA